MGMIPRMSRNEAINRGEFYRLLDRWLRLTNEQTIGEAGVVQGRTPWVWILVGGRECRLHADTKREGVAALLDLWRASPNLEWHVVANQRGRFNKVAIGDEKIVIPGLFLYLHEPTLTADLLG